MQRLHRVIALQSFGLSLEEIKTGLDADGHGDLAGLLRRQLEVVGERIRQAVALRVRLTGVMDALEQMAEPSVTKILQLIEETTIMNQPLTSERFAELKAEPSRQVRERNTEEFAEFSRKRAQIWTALSREEQARLKMQRRQVIPAAD